MAYNIKSFKIGNTEMIFTVSATIIPIKMFILFSLSCSTLKVQKD